MSDLRGRFWRAFAVVCAVAGPGCSSADDGRSAAAARGVVRLAVEGARNTAPSIAASGTRVVVVWAATVGGQTNVHAAVSHDGGLTFGAPVRVNDLPGDVRVGGEQPPRVAIGGDITVAWTSRLNG